MSEENITLDELVAPPKNTVTHDGKEYPVKPADGYAIQLVNDVPQGNRVALIRAMYKVAARCLRLSFDEVYGTEDTVGWSESEIMEVADIAQRQLRKVEASAKNDGQAGAASGETVTETPRPPASAPSMQLAS